MEHLGTALAAVAAAGDLVKHHSFDHGTVLYHFDPAVPIDGDATL